MNYMEDGLPQYPAPCSNSPCALSTVSSTSPSSSSVWSDSASQSSDDSSVTTASVTSDIDDRTSSIHPSRASKQAISITNSWLKQQNPSWPASQVRRHPRRTSNPAAGFKCPPPLARQRDRKLQFVSSLIDTAAQIVEAIWPLSSVVCPSDKGHVLPLKIFIREMLRRSKTSYSTLQVALYYLVLIRPHVPERDFTMEQQSEDDSVRALQCGRRMFLSALILATKYLQDRNYSAGAWGKISGLNTAEVNRNEMAFLMAVKFELFISDSVFQRWTNIVLKYSCPKLTMQLVDWKTIIQDLNLTLSEDQQDSIRTPDMEPLSNTNSRALTFSSLHAPRRIENSEPNTPAAGAISDSHMECSIDYPIPRLNRNAEQFIQQVYTSEQSLDKDPTPSLPLSDFISDASFPAPSSTICPDVNCETRSTTGLQKGIRTLLSSATYWTEDSIRTHTLGMGLSF
ncbi:hypothetical protein F5884DRAFT_752860 [Xylogone sp. PMI_703]|nr:hypothetical protein F5884DRAFT_752860 [Xylogone sp. PMI_703]